MKIVVTGSLGNISKPLTKELVQKGHKVTVISSKPEKQKDIESLGARGSFGSVYDVQFLASAFSGADAAYCMIPPGNYLDPEHDILASCHQIGKNYAKAIEQSGVRRVVHLSSIGAHLNSGSGLIMGHHDVEHILAALPNTVAITHMRPTAFYYNLYGFVRMIKQAGYISSNYGAEDRLPWVSPIDIAASTADEITTPLVGRKIRYVASDEPTCNEIAAALGSAIGKPDLKWVVIPDDELLKAVEVFGMPRQIAVPYVEMNASIHSGLLSEDYYLNRPSDMGKIKIKDFATEFARVYNQN